jgi:hypothetical protein
VDIPLGTRVWSGGRFLDASPNKKADKWKPNPVPAKVLWGLCECGESIYEGDAVWMRGDHEQVACFECGDRIVEKGHLDCAGLKLPGITLIG